MNMRKILCFGLCLTIIVSMLPINIIFASEESKAPSEKVDEILVEADAVGNIISKKASVTITGSDSTSPIKDKTKLSDIVNISGEEEFTQQSDGTIIWENEGNEINYTGSLNEELPFSMKVTYYLNDQEMTPAEIAGKSGRVKVEYSFENRVTVDVEVDGETYNTYVPFLTVTSITLPMEEFQNVEALDGGLVVEEFGNQYFMLGVATPGINESLNLELLGLDQYVKFPESFGFTADVTNFQMPSTVTSVSPHVVDKLDLSGIKTPEDMNNKIDELVSATEKIVDGSNELAGGTSLLSAGVTQFLKEFQNGLTQISEGSAELDSDLYDLEEKKSSLQGQAEELLTYLDSVLVQLNSFELPDADSIVSPELLEAEAKLKEDVALLIEALETMKSQLEEIQAFAEEAQVYIDQMTEIGDTVYEELTAIDLDQMIDDATALAKEQAIQAAKEELSGLPVSDEQLNTIVNNIMSKIDISSVADEARVHIAKVEEVLCDIPELEIPEFQVDVDPVIEILKDMETQFAVLEAASAKQEELVEVLNSAHEFLDSVKSDSATLKQKSSELISGLDFADSAIKNAHEYINSLKDAVSEADQGSEQLANGVYQLDDGAKQLADGTEQFYTEGILTAADYARQATLQAFLTRCKAYVAAAKEYTNISGIEKTTRGSIRFTIRTEEITVSNE